MKTSIHRCLSTRLQPLSIFHHLHQCPSHPQKSTARHLRMTESIYKAYVPHEMFQLSFNFLHPTPKDVQCNNFKVHETKLIHNLIYYTYLRDNLPHENLIYVNDQMTSPYFMKFAYIIKNKYMKGTLRNFDPVKNYYICQPIENPERPLIIPIEVLELAKNYHTYHINGNVPAKEIHRVYRIPKTHGSGKGDTKSGKSNNSPHHT